MQDPKQKNYTPPGVVAQMASFMRDDLQIWPNTVLDPSAGSGVFGRVTRHIWRPRRVVGVEVRDEEGAKLRGNYTEVHIASYEAELFEPASFDLIFTNPPFPLWREYVATAMLHLAPGGWLVMLGLRSWGSRSVEGYELFEEWRPTIEARIPATLGFRDRNDAKNTTDTRDYSWWCWKNVRQDKDGPGWLSFNLPRLPPEMRSWRGAEPGQEDAGEFWKRLGYGG